MKYELSRDSLSESYDIDNDMLIDKYENYEPYRVCAYCMPCINCIVYQRRLYRQQHGFPYQRYYNNRELENNCISNYYRQYLIMPSELQNLKGAKIRTTVPNISGTITAIVGKYNATTNRVELINIISDRTGQNYGNLTYLPEELSGLKVLSPGQGTQDGLPQGTQDCTVTGEKGKYIDSGRGSVGSASINYTIHECEIEITPRIAGIATQRYIINRKNNRIDVKWPTSPITRYVFTAWVENKALWVELESQHKILTGKWRRTGGAKTKLGSWSSLKI